MKLSTDNYMLLTLYKASVYPVEVSQFATVDLEPEVGGEHVGEELAGVLEVGLDVNVGPQQGDDQTVVLPWSWSTSLVDHYPESNV